MPKTKNKKNGFAALYITVLVMAFVFAAALSISLITLGQQKISINVVDSSQAYLTAEAGIEDALFRLATSSSWVSPYSFTVASSSVTTTISDIVGGMRTVTAEGNYSNRFRKLQVVYGMSSDSISFHYGAQVGEGGLVMGNNSQIIGNVFSNGDITGSGSTTNDVIVAGNGHKIQGSSAGNRLKVGGNAIVYSCKDSKISGNLTYAVGGTVDNCDVNGATATQTEEITPIALPISQSQIDEWKNAAAAVEVRIGDVNITGTQTLGPVKIIGNLSVGNGDTLEVNGTIYATGTIVLNQNSILKLKSSYGSLSGIIIADGTITTNNNVAINGSGQPGSYVLIISTSFSTNTANPAINVNNNAAGAIFYANSGLINLNNNTNAREITGYKIEIAPTAIVQYESGLASALFSSGPGGSWEVADWKEIE